MCRAKSDPNYYRCEWRGLSNEDVFLGLVAEARDSASITALGTVLNPTECAHLDDLMENFGKQIAKSLGRLTAEKIDQLRKDLRPARGRKRGQGHLVCEVAAAIGGACAAINQISRSVGATVGTRVKDATSSVLAEIVAEEVVTRMISMATASTPIGQVKEIGLVADCLAVAVCPAQQPGGRPSAHPEVVKCERRLSKRAVQESVADFVRDSLA